MRRKQDRQSFNPYLSNYWENSYPKPERYKEKWSDRGASDEVYTKAERELWKS